MIIYRELSSLENDLGVSAKTLYALSNNIEKHYHRVTLPKRSGGTRVLSVPDPLLKQVQRIISERLLSFMPVSRYATAYKCGSSVIKNANRHVKKTKILKLDIKNFFDRVLYSQVKEKAFPSERYSESNRVLLSMLCYYKDKLPQGAPSSPAITNIIMFDFDERVGEWCNEKGIGYTRYCDDMTFSGDFDDSDVVSFVSEELKKYGFYLNEKKTRSILNSQRQTVTGIVVNDRLNVPYDYRRRIRQEVYYCCKYGVEGHLAKIGFNDSCEIYLRGLLGRIAFALQADPENKALLDCKEFVINLIKNKGVTAM